jgi:decaprenylphospho-beta-D-ribofuranose 2-oxidase
MSNHRSTPLYGREDDLPACIRQESVASLVGNRHTESLVATPTTLDACRAALIFAREHHLTVCPRASGHSYGDQNLNDGNLLVSTSRMNRVLEFDSTTGRMVCEPGVQIIDVYRKAYAQGYCLPATPSEGSITVGGAIANNVNGKDSWRAGNFGRQVLQFRLLTAAGEIIVADRTTHADVFQAVIGGMGLLGLVVEATLQLERVASPYVETTGRAVGNLDDLLAGLAECEQHSDFALIWLDIYARGKNLGRAVIHSTRWEASDGDPEQATAEIEDCFRRLATGIEKAAAFHRVLIHFVSALLHGQRLTVRLFNLLYYGLSRGRGKPSRELFIEHNFMPNLKIPPVGLLCGPHGFTIQVVFSRPVAREAIHDLITACQAFPTPPVTTIMRLHSRDDHLISFAEDGYSLNFEFHPKRRHATSIKAHIDALVEVALQYGGMVHLAKDMILSRRQFEGLFPGHVAFGAVKRRLDPGGLFDSDMRRRLL